MANAVMHFSFQDVVRQPKRLKYDGKAIAELSKRKEACHERWKAATENLKRARDAQIAANLQYSKARAEVRDALKEERKICEIIQQKI